MPRMSEPLFEVRSAEDDSWFSCVALSRIQVRGMEQRSATSFMHADLYHVPLATFLQDKLGSSVILRDARESIITIATLLSSSARCSVLIQCRNQDEERVHLLCLDIGK